MKVTDEPRRHFRSTPVVRWTVYPLVVAKSATPELYTDAVDVDDVQGAGVLQQHHRIAPVPRRQIDRHGIVDIVEREAAAPSTAF
jgi:hypothetical protein